MITALYRWAKFKAEADGITVSPSGFNSAMEGVCFGKRLPRDIDTIYDPIAHLFEIAPREDPDYTIIIIDSNEAERPPNQKEMKFIMLPRRGLTGKAMQSFGGKLFWKDSLPKIAKLLNNCSYTKDHKIVKDKRGREKSKPIHVAKIPKDVLDNFQHHRLIDTYFAIPKKGQHLKKASEKNICSFCGTQHQFDSVRFVPPINLFVENVSNFTPFLSGVPSHSLCPYCAMLFMRTAVEGIAPPKVEFPGARQSYIYLLLYDSESDLPYKKINRQIAEEMLRTEFEKSERLKKFTGIYAIEYMLMLPIIILRFLPYSQKEKVNPYLYVVFADHRGKVETIVDHTLITRLDFLARVGKQLEENWFKKIFDFRERLQAFVKEFHPGQKVNGYKIVFRFLAKLLSDGEVDFAFLHNILRKEVNDVKRDPKRKDKDLYLGGFSYIDAFLKEAKYGRS